MIKKFNEFLKEANYTTPLLDSKPARDISFTKKAFDQYNEYGTTDRRIQKMLQKLIDKTVRDPFHGAKTEPLVGDFKGALSKRLDKKIRLVYFVTDRNIKIISCSGHYDDK